MTEVGRSLLEEIRRRSGSVPELIARIGVGTERFHSAITRLIDRKHVAVISHDRVDDGLVPVYAITTLGREELGENVCEHQTKLIVGPVPTTTTYVYWCLHCEDVVCDVERARRESAHATRSGL